MAVKVKTKVKRAGRKGLGSVQTAAKRIDEKRNAGNRKWFKIDDGETAILRVVDTGEDFKDGWVHPVEFTTEDDNGKERTYTADVMCLDQEEKGVPCPGCKDDLDRRYKFWTNVIARDWEDDDGNVADTVMIWSGGITVARKLDKMDAKHGLVNRDIEVEREGKKLNTKYDIDWADDENSELSSKDKKLVKDGKNDLSYYVKIRDFDDFYKSGKELNDDDDDNEDVGEQSRKRGSVFGGKKSSGGSTSRRTSSKKTGLAAVKARAESKGSGKASAKPKATIKVKRR